MIQQTNLDQSQQHLIVNQLVPPQHHGSITGKSTTTAVLELIDYWSRRNLPGCNPTVKVAEAHLPGVIYL